MKNILLTMMLSLVAVLAHAQCPDPLPQHTGTVCQGTVSIGFDPSSNNASNNCTYLWSTGATTPTLDITSQLSAGAFVGDTVAWVEITNSANTCTVYDTMTITFLPPVESIDLNAEDTIVCGISFTFQVTPKPSYTAYQWYDQANNPIAGETASSFTSNTPLSAYFVSITDNNGCKDGKTVNLDFATPPSNFLNASYDVCAADTLHIEDNVNSGMDYLWSNGSVIDSISLINGPANQNISVEVTDPGNGCTETFSTTVNTTAMPSLTASIIPPVGCDGSNELQMTTNVTDHHWQIEDGASFTDISGALTYAVPEDGTYQAIATSANGLCSSTVDLGFVLQYPGITQTTVEGFNSIPNLTNNPRRFKFEALQPVEVTNYKWYFGDGITSTDMSPEHAYTGNLDSVIVSLVVTNPSLGPCNYDSTALKIDVTGQSATGIGNLEMDNQFTVYPNPTNGKVYIKSVIGLKKIDLYDAVGRMVGSYSGNEVDLSGMPAGIYTLKAQTKSGQLFIRKANKL